MLRVLHCDGREFQLPSPGEGLPAGPWIDLLSPTAAETALISELTGIEIASRDELAEIETSSRMSVRDDVLYLSLPVVVERERGVPTSAMIGIVLSADRLVTIRFGKIPGFGNFLQTLRKSSDHKPGEVFVSLLEALVDRTADQLESIRDDMDRVTNDLFTRHSGATGPSEDNRALREVLQKISLTGDFVSRLHDTLMVMGRIVGFLGSSGPETFPAGLRSRVKILRQDVVSLKEFDAHLTNKVQFLLDATLGFINIAQSHIIKVLAVVGTVGVPPTLIASIYGMNFERMPELHFHYGYPVALTAILCSAVLPLLWFRRRGWL